MPASVDADPAPSRLRVPQQRIVEAALRLFGEYGISGTSLQMIADAVGVTKAAVYHQFKTKDEIIAASTEGPIRRLEAAVSAAEAEKVSGRALQVLLDQAVDLAIEYRTIVANLQGDPGMARFLSNYQPFQAVMNRFYRLITGPKPTARARVRAAMIGAALGHTAVHPLVADLDDRSLRTHMTQLAQDFLRLVPAKTLAPSSHS
jgi:AcrR family transcriptional regulator